MQESLDKVSFTRQCCRENNLKYKIKTDDEYSALYILKFGHYIQFCRSINHLTKEEIVRMVNGVAKMGLC